MSFQKMSYHVRLNHVEVPERAPGESDQEWEARLERFRQIDRRVAVDGHGRPNFGFGVTFTLGQGVIRGAGDWAPKIHFQDGAETGEVSYEPEAPGGWSLGEDQE